MSAGLSGTSAAVLSSRENKTHTGEKIIVRNKICFNDMKIVLKIEDGVDEKESPLLRGFKLILYKLISPWYLKHTLINSEFDEEEFDENEFNWWTKYYGFKYQKVVTL